MLYMVVGIETDFDAIPGEEVFPVVNYPEGIGSGYAQGEFLLSGKDTFELFANLCKLYDLRQHVSYFKYEDNYGVDDKVFEQLDRIEELIKKADDGTLQKDDFIDLNITIWEGEITIHQVASNRLIADIYDGINDLTNE